MNVSPVRFRWQIAAERPQRPGWLIFCIHGLLSMLDHVRNRDGSGWCLKLMIHRQLAHRQHRQKLVCMSFKRPGATVGMSTAPVWCLLEPWIAVVRRSGCNPVQTGQGLPAFTDLEVMPQCQQTVHHLPGRVLLHGQQTTTRGINSFLCQSDQCGIVIDRCYRPRSRHGSKR